MGSVKVRVGNKHLRRDRFAKIVDTIVHEAYHAWLYKKTTCHDHAKEPKWFARTIARNTKYLLWNSRTLRMAMDIEKAMEKLLKAKKKK